MEKQKTGGKKSEEKKRKKKEIGKENCGGFNKRQGNQDNKTDNVKSKVSVVYYRENSVLNHINTIKEMIFD